MKRAHSTGALWIVAMIAVVSSGCSSMRLRYQEPPPATSTIGEIALVVSDLRPPGNGGDDPLRVGTIRNTFGMPFPLKAQPSRNPSVVVEELVGDCLEASGYRVVAASEGVPQLHAALMGFWTDGYQHSRMILDLPLELRRDADSPPIWSHDVSSNTGVTWSVGYGQFDRGFTAMLEEARNDLLAQLGSPDFRESYQSLGPR
ncbi:MAG: hypothetical protein ACQGVK_10240 [Myxococcota bacterium]